MLKFPNLLKIKTVTGKNGISEAKKEAPSDI